MTLVGFDRRVLDVIQDCLESFFELPDMLADDLREVFFGKLIGFLSDAR